MIKKLSMVAKPHKTSKKWAWLGNFRPKERKIETTTTTTTTTTTRTL